MEESYTELFAADGALARQIGGYRPRQQQLDMAEAVADTLANLGTLVVEAGTGVGKTFAYLVPALISGRRVIISTGTRTLQDQLFKRDLPTVAGALGLPVEVALLKGRANYLCWHRLAIAQNDEQVRPAQWRELQRIEAWSRTTSTGDVGEVSVIDERARIWPAVTSTADNCLGQACEHYAECFVVKARRRAQEADVVIVNHHLLLADYALKEEGFADLLPGADALILDEAHQIPETAAQFFGVSLGSRQLVGLARDAVREAMQAGLGLQAVETVSNSLDKAVRDGRLAFARHSGRLLLSDVPAADSVIRSLDDSLRDLDDVLEPLAGHGAGLESCHRRARSALDRLGRLGDTADDLGVRWLELSQRGFALRWTPFETAEQLRDMRTSRASAWVMTSATLAVADSFEHFLSRTGQPDALSLKLDSPFDYASNSLLYLPKNMPDPASKKYIEVVCEVAERGIRASRGGAFLLFTSYRALDAAAAILGPNGALRTDFPLLVQGTAPRDHLLDQFRAAGNAVLLGTSSFWEGVDVRGAALKLVLIDKLPFASPGDPVLRARLDALRRNGENPFASHQLPLAVLALKQGVGRLIRDVTDTGVCIICDPRLRTRSYGKVFLGSLPPMPITNDFNAVSTFYQKHSHSESEP